MVEMNLRAKIIPDLSVLEKELKKGRKASVSGESKKQGFGGGDAMGFLGMEATLDDLHTTEKQASKNEKSNSRNLLGEVGKLVGLTSVIGIVISSLFDYIKPVFDILKAAIALLFLPLYRAGLVPLIKQLAEWLSRSGSETQEETNKISRAGNTALTPQVEGSAGELISNWKQGFRDWIDGIFNPNEAKSLFEVHLKTFSGTFMSGLGDVILGVFSIVGGFIDILWGIFTGDFDKAAQGIVNVLKGIYDIFVGVLKTVIGFAGTMGTALGFVIKFIVDIFKKAFDKIKDLGERIWKWIKSALSSVSDLGTRLWNWFKQALSSISNLGSRIWSMIKSKFGFGGGDVETGNDFVVTGGRVIKANPRDTIMATTDPKGLLSGSPSISVNSTINLNASISSDMDIRNVAEKVAEYQAEELARKTGYSRR